MPDLPQHPDSSEPGGPRRRPIGTLLGISVAVVLVAVFVLLHLTGVLGPGAH